jgi:hypothetical protein
VILVSVMIIVLIRRAAFQVVISLIVRRTFILEVRLNWRIEYRVELILREILATRIVKLVAGICHLLLLRSYESARVHIRNILALELLRHN